MPRKASHGWSMRQQGGYWQGGPIKKIFTATPTSKDNKQINSEIDQALSLQQAANIGALIFSKCFNCGSVKEHKTKDILSKSTPFASKGLKEISKKAVCVQCGSKNLRLQYKLDGKFRKKIKRSKPNYEKNSNQPLVSLSQQAMRGTFRSPKEAEKKVIKRLQQRSTVVKFLWLV